MDISKIKVKKAVTYETHNCQGSGVVVDVQTKQTGEWVVIHDATNRRYVTVRPSKVSPA